MTHIRGVSEGRLGRRNLLVGFSVGLALFVAIGAALAALAAPSPKPICPPYRPCGPPSQSPLVDLQVWRSSQYGYGFAYPADALSIVKQNGSGVILALADGHGLLIVGGSPASQGSISAAVTHEAVVLSKTLSGLTADTRPEEQILGSNVGSKLGSWGAYVGTFAGPEAPNRPTNVAIQAASNGKVIITTAALDFTASPPAKSDAYASADAVFNSIQWAP